MTAGPAPSGRTPASVRNAATTDTTDATARTDVVVRSRTSRVAAFCAFVYCDVGGGEGFPSHSESGDLETHSARIVRVVCAHLLGDIDVADALHGSPQAIQSCGGLSALHDGVEELEDSVIA